ncbi:MAG: 50S ribosomal protein L3 [Proteobacteria bacterium]|nr:50S ribosomal protein L3 [Pseudomonadota bacterium]
MSLELMGRKLGMTQIFNEAGDRVPVTVIGAGPCTVVQKKTPESDGYGAVQLGFEERKLKHLSKPLQGHYEKAETSPKRVLFEVRLEGEELDQLEVGQEIGLAEAFAEIRRVDVTGRSKGRGFTGVIKRHGFSTSSKSHGTHEFFRHAGALSAGTYPGRIVKGKKMAGHMGDEQVTTLGLRVEKIDAERHLIYLRGAVPGHSNGLVRIRPAVRARGES